MNSTDIRKKRRPHFAAPLAIFLLAACGSTGGSRPGSVSAERPTIRVSCEVQTQQDSRRVFNSELGSVLVPPAQQRIEVVASNENEARDLLRQQGVATPERPCTRIRVDRLQD